MFYIKKNVEIGTSFKRTEKYFLSHVQENALFSRLKIMREIAFFVQVSNSHEKVCSGERKVKSVRESIYIYIFFLTILL